MSARHFPLDELRSALISDGVQCDILPGAQGRSANMFASSGYYMGCQASVAHHTASSGTHPHWDIQYILNGKGEGYVISNAYTSRAGVVTLIASGPTYTEGSGGPYGIIPQSKANHVCFSNEIANRGDGSQWYTAEQMKAVVSLHANVNRIAARVWNWSGDPFDWTRLFSHFEWTSRKNDPFGPQQAENRYGHGMWDMNRFRSDCRNWASIPDVPAPQHGRIRAVQHRRILDTRQTGQHLTDGATLLVNVPGKPSWASSAFVNITTAQATGGGHLYVDPGTSTNNFQPDFPPVPNVSLVELDKNGNFELTAKMGKPGQVDVVIDLQGWGE